MEFKPVIKFLISTDFKKTQTLIYFSRLSILGLVSIFRCDDTYPSLPLHPYNGYGQQQGDCQDADDTDVIGFVHNQRIISLKWKSFSVLTRHFS